MSVEYIERAARACKLHNDACDLMREALLKYGDFSMEAKMASEYLNITKANRDREIFENRRLAMEQVKIIARLAFDNVEDLYDLIDFARRGYFPVVAKEKG